MSNLPEIYRLVDALTPPEYRELLDYLRQHKPVNAPPVKPRVLGLLDGQIFMSDDFDNELPDEFWGCERGLKL
jgi:hypothetical protein